MTGLRVSEVAALAGVPTSTVRFYERTGLLPAARRAANGYRVFDDTVIADLTLIARAKSLGLSLADTTDVVAGWRSGECRSLQARLRSHLTARLDQVRGQVADLSRFQGRLRSALGALTAHGGASPVASPQDRAPEQCGTGCGCDSVFDAPASGAPATLNADRRDDTFEAGEVAVVPGCSLAAHALDDRLAEWQSLADSAIANGRTGNTVRMQLSPETLPTATKLLALEAECCSEATFTLEVAAGQIWLTAEVPSPPSPPSATLAS